MIVYEGHGEVIACTKKVEKKVIKEFFTEGGRSLDDYERTEVGEYFSGDSRFHITHQEVGP